MELFQAKHRDPSLVAFMRDYAEDGPAWRERVAKAEVHLESTLDRLEAAAADAPFLSGERYGLADISWVVNANRLRQARVDLSRSPRFDDWALRVMARPTFDEAVASYTPD